MEHTTSDLRAVTNKGSKESRKQIDFKMVTFTLSGKDYGIDIMNVKEISKAGQFTFVPNSPSFVKGVYNLRGEIISIIDLRVMFNLPAPRKQQGELENVLILRFDEHIIGIIVDTIDKVVGISSETIQPPHPIFGDINIKFISGVVDYDNRLYIILDAERIFHTDDSVEKEEKKEVVEYAPVSEKKSLYNDKGPSDLVDLNSSDFAFISETLSTFKKYFVTENNSDWVRARFETWKIKREEQKLDLQLRDVTDADDFLNPFYSAFTGLIWSEEYLNEVIQILPDKKSGNFNVWNPGCGKGFETYSLAIALKEKYALSNIRLKANDKDLISISSAPSLIIDKNNLDDIYLKYLVEGKNGYQFSSQIKDNITFEYHDIMNTNNYSGLDCVYARDLISFLNPDQQIKFLNDVTEKLKPGGLLIVGDNERLPSDAWETVSIGSLRAYKVINS